jgi:Surface antigen variable number repeat
MCKRATGAGLVIMLAALSISAQVQDHEKCSGKIYGGQEVTKRARILEYADVSMITRAEPNVHGKIVLAAVLCRSGRVTDIRIVKGLSPTVNEFTIAALKLVRFVPAELRWQSVSQRTNFEFNFGVNEPGKEGTSADAPGRLVEAVNIIGHRRLTTEQILSWIKTRPGEPYSAEQIKRDFEAVLATGNFDKTQTRVTMDDGVRGGVVLTFMVVELPLVGEIKFEGLRLDPSLVFDAWKKKHIDLRAGGPYDVLAIKSAVRIIKQVLDENGQSNSRVELLTNQPTATTVNITFVITPNQ